MLNTTSFATLLAAAAFAVPGAAFAASDRPWVGDPVHGGRLYARDCAACHGDDGSGGRTGVTLRQSGRMNALLDANMFQMIKSGKGVKDPAAHSFGDKLTFLETWDVVAAVRAMHLGIGDFFPKASRYVSKEYTIDEHGLKRLEETTGARPTDKGGHVYTFFQLDGEEGRLAFVPQDPILLDELKKDKKVGYLVFLPFETPGYKGEIGVAMDGKGVISKIAVHESGKDADLMNKSLSRFEGLGKKGNKEPFKVGGGKTVGKLGEDVFKVYQLAMETVTMYDREESERTWADEQ